MRSFLLLCLLLLAASCEPDIEEVPLPTGICITTQHHTWIVPHSRVYVKFNVESFPGYDRPPGYFDASFETGADARGCLNSVPEGRHWLIAFGYDSLYWPHEVYGSMRAVISLDKKPYLDTIMYVSE
ncbi:MAG: hypothetical protein IT269_01220 [Saprospiraceae bacterium]|nr:hypothetical protein [Saprospiraceae bacterium]